MARESMWKKNKIKDTELEMTTAIEQKKERQNRKHYNRGKSKASDGYGHLLLG